MARGEAKSYTFGVELVIEGLVASKIFGLTVLDAWFRNTFWVCPRQHIAGAPGLEAEVNRDSLRSQRCLDDVGRHDDGGEATGETAGAPNQHGSTPPSGLQVLQEGGMGLRGRENNERGEKERGGLGEEVGHADKFPGLTKMCSFQENRNGQD
ncbi:hypothetical protein TRIUR3_33353 [Triticum urartu]|uniref:Uncharacterized protein n=1 Tax=Triticum urartu TaxID=4572 RepID=M7YYG8_TRIUA|nr:hypothetical protein TRIUR3_33353 [Triticum urartu]